MGKLADMFERRADSNRKNANRYWSKAINNEGDYNYGKARQWYNEESRNRIKAEEMRNQGK